MMARGVVRRRMMRFEMQQKPGVIVVRETPEQPGQRRRIDR
jgi:hypothetical protein